MLGDEVFENPFAMDDYIFETSPSSKMVVCLQMNTLWKINILLLMMIQCLQSLIIIMITIILLKLVIVMERLPKTIPLIYNVSIRFKLFMMNLLPLLLMRRTFLTWRVLILLCIMIRIFQVMVILWISLMMLLKVIMREGSMVISILIIFSFPSLC